MNEQERSSGDENHRESRTSASGAGLAPTGLPDNSAKAPGEGRIEINRREFGRLLSATGVAAYAASEPVLAAVTGISGAAPAGALRTFTTRESAFTVDAKGSLCAITFHGRNYPLMASLHRC